MSDETPKPADAPEPPSFFCPRGQDCGGEYLTEDPQYTAVDLFWLFLGVSSRPVRFKKYCAMCGHVDSISEPRRPY